jgi:Spy/CpxP family protein refolding chaperone
MKTIILSFAMFAFAPLTFAQTNSVATPQTSAPTKQKTLSPEDRAIRVLRMMTSRVGLKDNQQAEVKAILIDRENAKAEAKKLTEKSSKKVKTQEAQSNADDKLQKVLTPEQWTAWVKFKEEQKAKKVANKDGSKSNEPQKEEDFY